MDNKLFTQINIHYRTFSRSRRVIVSAGKTSLATGPALSLAPAPFNNTEDSAGGGLTNTRTNRLVTNPVEQNNPVTVQPPHIRNPTPNFYQLLTHLHQNKLSIIQNPLPLADNSRSFRPLNNALPSMGNTFGDFPTLEHGTMARWLGLNHIEFPVYRRDFGLCLLRLELAYINIRQGRILLLNYLEFNPKLRNAIGTFLVANPNLTGLHINRDSDGNYIFDDNLVVNGRLMRMLRRHNDDLRNL